MKKILPIVILLAFVGVGLYYFFYTHAPTTEQISQPSDNKNSFYRRAHLDSIKTGLNVAKPMLELSFEISNTWQIEYVPKTEAINAYDPSLPDENNLEKSQIFIRYFNANDFLTLSTVHILERTRTSANGRPAVNYVIEKKSHIAPFEDQPYWRSEKHRVLDIRSTDQNPTTFYVFAKRPSVSDAEFERFLNSVQFGPTQATLYYPIKDFLIGITKKPFGVYITPETSPVQPDRFTGYHTGVDVEIFPGELEKEIKVYSISNGIVVRSERVNGYGGLLMIEHTVSGRKNLGIYGHLDPDEMKSVGATVYAGEQIAILGDDKSEETDFTRKHLHFGLYQREPLDIRGYVQTKQELSAWLDPVSFFKQYTLAEPE